jgi:hypothetical protein
MNGYTPKVGDRVRLPYWDEGQSLDVRYVDPEGWLVGVDNDGDIVTFSVNEPWQLVPPPPVRVREAWVLVNNYGTMIRWFLNEVAAKRLLTHGDTLTQLRVIDGKDIPDDIRVLVLCHEDGTPANVEAVES